MSAKCSAYRKVHELPELTKAFKKFKKEQNVKRGSMSNRRGAEAEERLLRCLENCPSLPQWVQSIRRASQKEDGRGIDLVCNTNYGKLYLQVKSSFAGAAEFCMKKRKCHTLVVVVNNDIADEELISNAKKALRSLKKSIHNKRRNGVFAPPKTRIYS
jgi:hypothetical protein